MPETLNLDDLAVSRLIAVQRTILEHTDARSVDLWIEGMLAEAERTAGVADFGDHDFMDRLAVYVGAIEGDDELSSLSQRTLRNRVVRLLRSRLLLTDLFNRYPEIECIEIEKPRRSPPRSCSSAPNTVPTQRDPSSSSMGPLAVYDRQPTASRGPCAARRSRTAFCQGHSNAVPTICGRRRSRCQSVPQLVDLFASS
jgi:hypothetical protein